MIFTKNLYRKARNHYVSRAVQFRTVRDRIKWEVSFGDYDIALAERKYREAASMARKIVERGNREHGLWKYSVGEK